MFTILRSEEERQEGGSDEVDGADVDVEEAVEVLGLGGFNGADVADSGVIDEDVEAGDPGDGGGDGVGAGDVKADGLGGPQNGGQGFSRGEVDVGDIDVGASAGQLFRGGFADAAGASGDEGVAIVETEGGGLDLGGAHEGGPCECVGAAMSVG